MKYTIPDLIEKKRDGKELAPEEVSFFVHAVKEHLAENSQIGIIFKKFTKFFLFSCTVSNIFIVIVIIRY